MLTRTEARPARNADIPFIMDLLSVNDLLVEGLDWSDIGTDWWVTVHHGAVIGCVQVLMGKPLGVVNCLAVDPRFHGSGVGVQLIKTAEIILGAMGCDGYLASTSNELIKNKADRLGITDLGEVNIFVKRVFRYAKDTPKNDYRH